MPIALSAVLVAGTVTTATAPTAQAVVHDPSGNVLDAKAFGAQIAWLDFNEPGVISGTDIGPITSGQNGTRGREIHVGTVYTKEVYPGYVVKAEVVSLAPLMGDDVNWGRAKTSNTRGETAVVASAQTQYSHLKRAGLATGAAFTTIGAHWNGGNVGMTLRFTATINDVPTTPTIVVTDGEEATDQEFELFKTTGTPWKLMAEARANNKIPSFLDGRVTLDKDCGWCWNNGRHPDHNGQPYAADVWKAVNADAANLGLGTDTFGPVVTSMNSRPGATREPATLASVPIVMTSAKNTTDNFDVSFYVNSPGIQTVQFGIVVMEEGDAPESYGKAGHLIREAAGTTLPYLGKVRPDVLQNPNGDAGDWNMDDLSDAADEGIAQLRNDGTKTYAPYYGANNTFNLPVYVTPGSSNGQVTPAYVNAWADFNNNGKFDANERGTLEAPVTAAGSYNVVFKNLPQTLKADIHELGIRVRVANNASEIEQPTGVASSGEVEDFKIRLVLPPRGEKETTTGPQGVQQSAKVDFTARGRVAPTAEMLEADAANVSGGETVENTIDPAVPIQIVSPDGTLVTTWTEPGEGTYVVAPDGTVTFTPEATFFGTAKGVVLRATDKNGNTTGWTSGTEAQIAANTADAQATGESVSTLYEVAENINSNGEGAGIYGNGSAETMDGVYIPTVTPSNIVPENKETTGPQGETQEETLVFKRATGETLVIPGRTNSKPYFVNEAGDKIAENTIDAIGPNGDVVGSYTLDPETAKVVFTPNPDFFGTPKPARVKLDDTEEVGGLKPTNTSAIAVYQPHVTPLSEIVPTAVTSTNLKDVNQVGTPTFANEDGSALDLNGSTRVLLDKDGQPATGNTTSAYKDGQEIGTYTLDPATGEVTFDPNPDFVGTAEPARVKLTTRYGKSAIGEYTPTVVPTPVGTPAVSEGWQGETQTGTPTFTQGGTDGTGEPLTPSAQTPAKLVGAGGALVETLPATSNGKNVGTYTINPETGLVTFTPEKSFFGTPDPVTVSINDKYGQAATATYTPTVKKLTPAGSTVTSEGPQGDPQSKVPTWTDGKNQPLVPSADRPARLVDPETGKPTDKTEIPATSGGKEIGTYVIEPNTGKITFTPNPSFVGDVDPVSVVLTDDNGTPATSTYTPKVTPVTPEGNDVTSEGWQGETQTGTPTFTDGKGGTLVPSAERPARFIDPATGQVTEETSIPAKKDGETIGTYVIDPATGTVTFTPNKSFTGTPDPVTVQVTDKNGTPATGNYTPTVKPLTPTGSEVTSTGPQGAEQTGVPTYRDGHGQPLVPSATRQVTFVNPETKEPIGDPFVPAYAGGKVIGQYSISPATGEITFTPHKTFVGTADPVQVQIQDDNGTRAYGTYTPTVTPLTPQGSVVTSEGDQGQPQEKTPTWTDGKNQPLVPSADRPARLVDPETGKPTDKTEIPATSGGKVIGTYVIEPNTGKITFTPNPSFTGTADPARAVLTDDNGTPATSTYTPTVNPVVPEGVDVTSEGWQGETQTGTPTFTDGKGGTLVPSAERPARFIDPATGQVTEETSIPAKKDGETIGTYVIDPATGTVTFTPNKSFTGTPDPVTVQVTDKNGTPATGNYTPLVKPLTPRGTPATTTELQTETHTATVDFVDGHGNPMTPSAEMPVNLIDPNTGDKVTEVVVPGVGTYTVVPETGVITFVPEISFVGNAPAIEVVMEDSNGTPARTTYTPIVTPKPPVGDPATSTGDKGKTQTGTPTFTGGSGTPLHPSPKTPVMLIDPDSGTPVTSVTIPEVGTYTVTPETGLVTFTPVPNFVGEAPSVTVEITDENGLTGRTTYTPTVVEPVVPAPAPTPGGQPGQPEGKVPGAQSGTPATTPTPALASTGATAATLVGGAVLLLLVGGAVVLMKRK